jgi:hypothetical protein
MNAERKNKRVVFTMGGKGGVGKTGLMVALAEWFEANEIPFTLLDLDTENKARGSLKHFFNGSVAKVNIHTPAGLDTFIDHLESGAAIILADMGAGLLSRIQNLEPERMYVVLGGGVKAEEFVVQRYIAYYRRIKREYETAWKAERDTYPEPTEHCEVCSWYPLCDKRRRDDDHLSFVAGISRNQRKALGERSVSTVAGLAELALPLNPKIDRIGEAALFGVHSVTT